tara:strand:+ start:21055 stop:21426 length:372 start_codon:yes stop_codon:yes gene_type:complete
MDLLKVKLLADRKVVQETTNRIGIANKKKKVLFPSCYIYEHDGETYLVHFKELFALRENGYNNVSEEDLKRRNAVAFCLKNWGLIDIELEDIEPYDTFVFVLPHKDKHEWKINHKVNLYTLNQ